MEGREGMKETEGIDVVEVSKGRSWGSVRGGEEVI